ncbi:unnamed protein product [Sphenostylis stenocarpa]|uniref:Uncharacterized protein n=1 Tax=Sphenostylis stenocarpa TaxID=92480 RepID=A0AA86V2P5_9FABA|nr:unnamed protein product [Sphenostylis stenocarpa]
MRASYLVVIIGRVTAKVADALCVKGKPEARGHGVIFIDPRSAMKALSLCSGPGATKYILETRSEKPKDGRCGRAGSIFGIEREPRNHSHTNLKRFCGNRLVFLASNE